MQKVKIIACLDKNNGIGKDNALLYNIGNDMTNFKSQTIGNVVIMGRKTFESLPGGGPLDGRINIIITSDESFAIDDCDHAFIVHSIEDALELCEAYFFDKEWFVIGGGSIYQQFLDKDLVGEMRLTVVNDVAEADTFFPSIDLTKWRTYYKSMAQTSSYNNVDRTFYFEVLKRNDVK